jgi:ribonuclease BN (tRNA processing enzyme)
MTADGAGRTAAAAGVGHLVLCHTYPDTDLAAIAAQARDEYAGTITVALDGTEVVL